MAPVETLAGSAVVACLAGGVPAPLPWRLVAPGVVSATSDAGVDRRSQPVMPPDRSRHPKESRNAAEILPSGP